MHRLAKVIGLQCVMGALVVFPATTWAHHSFSMFDMATNVTLEGTIREVQWTNPHIWIQVLVKDAGGREVEWSIEGGSPNMLGRAGWTRHSLKAGDKATVVIHPLKQTGPNPNARGGGLVSVNVAKVAQPVTVPVAAAPSTVAKRGPGSLSGIWTVYGYKGSMFFTARERVARTLNGEWPPLKPEAAAILERRVADSDRGDPFPTTLAECLPGGVPEMVFGSPYPVQILETPGQVTMLYEMSNHFRIIRLDGRHPQDPDPTFMGHSIGRWDGDTFVVDTIGLTDRTSLDEVGIPHSDALRVTERYRRVDAATLDIVLSIDDPKVFARKWDAKVVYKAARPGSGLIEYICANNRSID